MKPVWKILADRAFVTVTLAGALLAGAASAGDLTARIELGASANFAPDDFVTAPLGGDEYNALNGTARLMYSDRIGEMGFELHYRVDGLAGDAASLAAAGAGLATGVPPYTLFDLTADITRNSDLVLTHAIDRLSLTHTTPKTVLRIGRQAVTWGAGNLFHPMDIVAPFAPEAQDTEFKPGVDMGYLQVLFDDGSDLEVIAVPRAATQGGQIDAQSSTLGGRYRTFLGETAASFALAADHGDTTAGIGLSGDLAGAGWNLEWVPTITDDGGTFNSTLANVSYAFPVGGTVAVAFAEYFHNGFGTAQSGPALDSLPSELAERMARGQVFTVNQDYLALGLSTELGPLLSAGGSSVINLADGSYLTAFQLNWSVSDNGNVILGAQIPNGERGTEFGGLPLSGNSAPFAGPERSAYLLYRQYF